MKVKQINFSTYLENNRNIENARMDVLVELENGYASIFDVVIPKNIEYQMDKDQRNYYKPVFASLIVKKLTKHIIEEAVQAYAANKEDGYWIKLYHFAGKIKENMFQELEDDYRKEREELDE